MAAAAAATLFAASVADNVRLATRAATPCSGVGLAPWIRSLPDGLATEVGEAGARVSGGQRQRIAAARLLLCDARFLLFDEPTTHFDPAGAERRLTGLAERARPSTGASSS